MIPFQKRQTNHSPKDSFKKQCYQRGLTLFPRHPTDEGELASKSGPLTKASKAHSKDGPTSIGRLFRACYHSMITTCAISSCSFIPGVAKEIDAPEIPAELPEFSQTGARYLVTSGEATEREETLDFLEAIHTLYDENRQKLHTDRELAIEHQKERQRQIKIEAAKPKTRVLKIWRHTRPEENQAPE